VLVADMVCNVKRTLYTVHCTPLLCNDSWLLSSVSVLSVATSLV